MLEELLLFSFFYPSKKFVFSLDAQHAWLLTKSYLFLSIFFTP
jgi:hypothetical protein